MSHYRADDSTPRTAAEPYVHSDGFTYTQRDHPMCHGCVGHSDRKRLGWDEESDASLCAVLRHQYSSVAPNCAGPWIRDDNAPIDKEIL